VFLRLFEKWCHTTRTAGQTPQEKKFFLGFLENKCHTVRVTGQTQ